MSRHDRQPNNRLQRTVCCALVAASTACRGASEANAWSLTLTEESIPGVHKANALGVGDFNGDGRADLVVLGGAPGELLVLLNRSGGRFVPSAQGVLPAGRTASGLAVGDVDGDGLADVVVSHHDDFELRVLLGSRDGTLRPAPGSPATSALGRKPHSHNLVLADLNDDGRLDLLQAQSELNVVLVLLGDGKGGFAPAAGSPVPAGRHPYTLVVGDWNTDGALAREVPSRRFRSSLLAAAACLSVCLL